MKSAGFLAAITVLSVSFSVMAARTNLALNKTAIADSYVGARTPAMAVDGINSGESRWENNYLDGRPDSLKGNGWLYVDLGSKYLVDSVAIYWEHSGSGKYAIQVWDSSTAAPSDSDTGWTTLLIDTTLTYTDAVQRCLSFLKLPPRETRYVRMRSYKRLWNPGWGISIYEFEIYGTPVSLRDPALNASADHGLFSFVCTKSFVRIQSVNKAPHLLVDILSTTGKLIRSLSGSEASLWDYKDANGRGVTNGMYVLRVTSAGKTVQDRIAVYR
jgi:F5/8 type C domain